MSDAREEAKTKFAAVCNEYDADLYVYSASIDDKGFGKIVDAVISNKSRQNALLILVTNGGLANSAYQIARFFQKIYADGKFIVFAPSYCKSAGTLVVLGANQLLMDEFSELGPLDVQLLKQDEIGTRKSGLLSRSSFQALQEASFDLFESLMLEIKRKSGDLISFRLASEVSAKMTGELMSQVYGQMIPDIIGGDYRDLQVALHYGIRLIGFSGNAPPLTVKHLVEHYPSHDFVIDDEEASTLFYDVKAPSENLYSIIELLGDAAYNEDRMGLVLALNPNDPKEESDNGSASEADAKDGPGGTIGGGEAEQAEVVSNRESDRTSDSEAPRNPPIGGSPSRAARRRVRKEPGASQG